MRKALTWPSFTCSTQQQTFCGKCLSRSFWYFGSSFSFAEHILSRKCLFARTVRANSRLQVLYTENWKKENIHLWEKLSHGPVLPAPPNSKHFVGSAYPEHFDILVFLWQKIFLSMRKGARWCQLGPSCYVPKCIVLWGARVLGVLPNTSLTWILSDTVNVQKAIYRFQCCFIGFSGRTLIFHWNLEVNLMTTSDPWVYY